MNRLTHIIEVSMIENYHGKGSRLIYEYKQYYIDGNGEKRPQELSSNSISGFIQLDTREYHWPNLRPVVSQIDPFTVRVLYRTDSTE